MTSSQYSPSVFKVIFFTCFVVMIVSFMEKPSISSTDQPVVLASLPTTESHHPSDSSTKQVSVYDQGLQMMRGAYTIPTNWLLQQDVYTPPQTYGYHNYNNREEYRFMVSFNGPTGEIIRCREHWGSYQWGKATDFYKFQPEVDSLIRIGLLSHLDNLVLGTFSANNPTEAQYLANYVKIDSVYQYLEAPFSGELDGQACEGIVRVLYPNPISGYVNMVSASVILSPLGKLTEVMEVENQIAFSYRANPTFEQYWVYRGRAHDQYIDQINKHIPEPPGWHPDSTYQWGNMEGWNKIKPNY
ncbi:MAG: hypothetical protein ACFB15_14195 [Cyclobacteriaceae bacterium]